MAKKRMPIYRIISIFRQFLAHNLAKSQYFSMRPSSFDYYYHITYYLKVLAKYLKKMWILYPKNLKHFTKSAMLVLFVQSRSLKKLTFKLDFQNFDFGTIFRKSASISLLLFDCNRYFRKLGLSQTPFDTWTLQSIVMNPCQLIHNTTNQFKSIRTNFVLKIMISLSDILINFKYPLLRRTQ